MKDFIDLQGASGVAYRFRRWSPGAPPAPMGGNFAVVRAAAGGLEVLQVGLTNNLAAAHLSWPDARRGGAHVFMRLNVARAIREAEHADLAALYGAAPAPVAVG